MIRGSQKGGGGGGGGGPTFGKNSKIISFFLFDSVPNNPLYNNLSDPWHEIKCCQIFIELGLHICPKSLIFGL